MRQSSKELCLMHLNSAKEDIDTMIEQLDSDDPEALQTFFEFYLQQQESMLNALDKSLAPVVSAK